MAEEKDSEEKGTHRGFTSRMRIRRLTRWWWWKKNGLARGKTERAKGAKD
jgi:hypothetical protein